MKKSMLDVAYEIVRESEGPVAYHDILLKVGEILELDEETLMKKAAQLYTNLLRDGRFVTLGENTWDLRTRNKFDKVHIDMNLIYREDEEEEEIDDFSKPKDVEEEIDEEKDPFEAYPAVEEVEEVEPLDGFAIKSLDDEESEE